jgi:hypothetical protein
MSAVNGFNVGKDISLSVQNPNGNLLMVGLTSFSSKKGTIKLKSKRLGGKTFHGNIPDGWSGTFKIDRVDPSVDIFFANADAGYYAGQSAPEGTIQEVISELDGSTTTWQYTGVVLTLDDAGNWEGDKKVEQTISFEATDRTQVV